MRRQLPQAPQDRLPSSPGQDIGPKVPDVKKPESNSILKRMKRVDPDLAKRYRQRSGQ